MKEAPKCVPLCGATKAYGKHVLWWHHQPQCPARINPAEVPR
jgi:hypothetical protein